MNPVQGHSPTGMLRLRLNRPEARNAFNTELRRELTEGFVEADADDDVKAVGPASAVQPLQAALALECKSLRILFGTDDRKEGMAAFLAPHPSHFGRTGNRTAAAEDRK